MVVEELGSMDDLRGIQEAVFAVEVKVKEASQKFKVSLACLFSGERGGIHDNDKEHNLVEEGNSVVMVYPFLGHFEERFCKCMLPPGIHPVHMILSLCSQVIA